MRSRWLWLRSKFPPYQEVKADADFHTNREAATAWWDERLNPKPLAVDAAPPIVPGDEWEENLHEQTVEAEASIRKASLTAADDDGLDLPACLDRRAELTSA